MDVRIDRATLPPEEHEASSAIEDNLRQLQMLADEFRHSLDLYLDAHRRDRALGSERSDESWRFVAWMRISGRNGAIVAYSFSQLMHAINASKAPTLWQRIDMAEREAANRLFSAEFPRIEHVRQTAAHPGELSKSAVEAAKHRLREAVHNERIQVAEDSGIFIQSMVHAAEDHMIYSSTFKGQLVEYELSTRKANALAAVVGHYRRAFYPAEDPQWAQMRKMIEASQRSRRT